MTAKRKKPVKRRKIGWRAEMKKYDLARAKEETKKLLAEITRFSKKPRFEEVRLKMVWILRSGYVGTLLGAYKLATIAPKPTRKPKRK
jgi:hypothetical protein